MRQEGAAYLKLDCVEVIVCVEVPRSQRTHKAGDRLVGHGDPNLGNETRSTVND
jgi:hypothetical protein